MKTLHLVLKREWYDKIASGEKTSEYRECKPYWNKRLSIWHETINGLVCDGSNMYEAIIFHRGYTAETMEFEIKSIAITTEKNDLNLPQCWEIKLGARIK